MHRAPRYQDSHIQLPMCGHDILALIKIQHVSIKSSYVRKRTDSDLLECSYQRCHAYQWSRVTWSFTTAHLCSSLSMRSGESLENA